MVNRASLEHFNFLVDESSNLSAHYAPNPLWAGSTFEWMIHLPPGSRGAVGRHLIKTWVTRLGLTSYLESDHNQHYVVVNGHRVQVKLSTLWDTGTYRFQQIRDQDYEYLLFVGISPDDINTWLIPKSEAFTHLLGSSGQHTGAGAAETLWIELSGSSGPEWAAPYGNQLSVVEMLLRELD